MLKVKPLENRDYELTVILPTFASTCTAEKTFPDVVLTAAISEGDHEFETIVAVAHPHPHEDIENCLVVAPCGMCRELISDYGKDTDVIFPYKGELVKCNEMELLPEKYTSDIE
ncbi:cytidine deaminase [Peribacillus sp. NPDC097895]|uniref:cytidine deaminase n=1 Tax=Peribacillus sp. NPDC097895 TaxID=3390619 RepID=UPI003D023388